jgi:glycerol-3-phosphate dehydrogenase (NAD(P)+)
MTLNSISEKPVGVIGAGNFGTVIANILALQRRVLLYARNEQAVAHMREAKENRGYPLHHNVEPTHDLAYLASQCDVIVSYSAIRTFS